MVKVILLWLVASLLPALCQSSSGGIESIQVGMSHETVDVALNHQNVMKASSPQDKTQDVWSFIDSGGTNTIIFQNGRVVSVDAHVAVYRGDGRDLVKKLYALLYLMTKATVNDERTATATVALREYPSVTGDDPIRHIELRFGDRHIDLNIIEAESLSVHAASVGQGVGHAPSNTK
jgi:hypothetical protein